jgi:hypothetical protein
MPIGNIVSAGRGAMKKSMPNLMPRGKFAQQIQWNRTIDTHSIVFHWRAKKVLLDLIAGSIVDGHGNAG